MQRDMRREVEVRWVAITLFPYLNLSPEEYRESSCKQRDMRREVEVGWVATTLFPYLNFSPKEYRVLVHAEGHAEGHALGCG